MSDDWKWVLRSSMQRVPSRILSTCPAVTSSPSAAGADLLRYAGGRKSFVSGDGPVLLRTTQSDLGTTFALRHPYSEEPFAVCRKYGLRHAARFPRPDSAPLSARPVRRPRLKFTMQQVSMQIRAAGVFGGEQRNAPLRWDHVRDVLERTEVAEGLDLDYGASLDSVTLSGPA